MTNYNCTILDVAKVTFSDNCMLGPNVAIYTAGHPFIKNQKLVTNTENQCGWR